MFNALDAHNLDAIADYLHDEFIYFSDYELKNKEDWLQEMQSHIDTKESNFTLDRQILSETKDCYAIERVATLMARFSNCFYGPYQIRQITPCNVTKSANRLKHDDS